MRQHWRLLAGPLIALLVLWLADGGLSAPARITLVVTALCISWWLLEALPMAVTAMLPLALFPLTGVVSSDDVAHAYGSPIILLMLGGFVLSRAMERSNTHYHLALMALHAVGSGSERRLVVGFMLASAMLSMWISNTATTLMLLPVALALLQNLRAPELGVPLMLGIAYAASIGGIGTPVGTPPNLVFMQVYADTFGREIGFVQWMGWALPVVALLLPAAMLWLTRGLSQPLAAELPERLPWNAEQRRVLAVFALTILAWVTRSEPFGGWSAWLGLSGASDATVALLAAVALFVVPDGRGGRLMDWEHAVQIPWGILLLFGGGLCIAKAFASSGLSAVIADQLQGLAGLPPWALLLALCASVTLLTEATSNMATASLLMPLLAAAALAMGLAPETLMVPAVISASCAFTLPIATAPNAIVYGSGAVPMQRMAREGIVLSAIGALIIAGLFALRA